MYINPRDKIPDSIWCFPACGIEGRLVAFSSSKIAQLEGLDLLLCVVPPHDEVIGERHPKFSPLTHPQHHINTTSSLHASCPTTNQTTINGPESSSPSTAHKYSETGRTVACFLFLLYFVWMDIQSSNNK